MLTDEILLERTGLLLSQREVLLGSRYAGLQQLREHDAQLLDGLRLLRRRSMGRSDSSDNCAAADGIDAPKGSWLAWLLTPLAMTSQAMTLQDATPLHAPDATLSEALWLAAVKLALDERPARQLLASSALGGGSEFSWQLASYLTVPGLAASDSAIPGSTASGLDVCEADDVMAAYFWYLASTGQVAAKDRLLAYAGHAYAHGGTTTPLALQAKLALYLLGQGGDEPYLFEQLLQQGLQDSDYVALLLCGAPVKYKVSMLNLLMQTDKMSTQVSALGYSGLSKFVPLLRDLATQPAQEGQPEQSELAEAAADALCLLLGVTDGERLLVGDAEPVQVSGSEPILAGQAVEGDALQDIWHRGNQAQRRAAAYHAKLRRPDRPLARPEGLLGGQWHSC